MSGVDYRGEQLVLAAWRPVAGTDWHLIAKLDREEALEPARTIALWTAAVALFGVTMVVAAIFLLVRQQRIARELALEVQADRLLRHFYEFPFISMAITSLVAEHWLKFNDRLCAMFVYAREEMAKTNWVDLNHPEAREQDLAEFDRVIRESPRATSWTGATSARTGTLYLEGSASSVCVSLKVSQTICYHD